ncbi:hypothetical protein DXG01_005858 [Tephrocybe rancida]|nr:hypothetical protein DXG01_005858 [Tephrocybe rancida]
MEVTVLTASRAPDSPPQSLSNLRKQKEDLRALPYAPHPNCTAFQFKQWYWNKGSQKLQESFRSLIKIIKSKDFNPDDICGINWTKINTQLGLNDWDDDKWKDADAGWRTSSIAIQIPFHRFTLTKGAREFIIKNFYRRPLVSVIREKLALKKEDMRHFHLEPFDLIWRKGGVKDPVRLYGEIYMSPSFAEAHRALQLSPPEPDCQLPHYVVSLMFWSDGTHLTNFGTASVTPLYMQFGNESKYMHCKPSTHLTEHVAYFEEVHMSPAHLPLYQLIFMTMQLPDDFKLFASHYIGKNKIDSDFLSHCRRELAHAQWQLLLDNDFVEAYRHGIVVEWADGVSRRFYPQIFCHSADYKEKCELLLPSPILQLTFARSCIRALMAMVKMNGLSPCPRRKVSKSASSLFGTTKDRRDRILMERVDNSAHRYDIVTARAKIYNEDYAVDSAFMKCLLIKDSLVPTPNVFSDQLGPELLGLKWFEMFVIDLLHEIELGIWKHLFIHLLHILESLKSPAAYELDRRFYLVPTFGHDTIRKFARSVSELKKMAVRDYEDLLQCIIPVFDGLLDISHDTPILDLLFHFAHWHRLAKLHLHSELSLAILDEETTNLGVCLQNLQNKMCTSFDTQELQREKAAYASS